MTASAPSIRNVISTFLERTSRKVNEASKGLPFTHAMADFAGVSSDSGTPARTSLITFHVIRMFSRVTERLPFNGGNVSRLWRLALLALSTPPINPS